MALPLGETYPVYSREEKLADAALHLAGIAAALVGVPVMVTLAAVWYGDAPALTGAVVYGLGLIAMLVFSASYHMMPNPRVKAILRRFDHGAIYVMIAASYTPFALLLAGAKAELILDTMWGAALLGLALKLTIPRRIERLSLVLYLAMGWAILIIGRPILDGISPAGLVLMLTGGALYMVGVVFFLWERLRFHNVIWHGLVLAASTAIYAAVLVEVARGAPMA